MASFVNSGRFAGPTCTLVLDHRQARALVRVLDAGLDDLMYQTRAPDGDVALQDAAAELREQLHLIEQIVDDIEEALPAYPFDALQNLELPLVLPSAA